MDCSAHFRLRISVLTGLSICNQRQLICAVSEKDGVGVKRKMI